MMIICDKCVHKMSCIDYGTKTDQCKYCDPITNEEWFCSLPTEEKAKVFANATYSTAETPLTILWGVKEAEQKKWELWLKQPHTKGVEK